MRILLVNDDGYQSEGINVLESVLSQKHEVLVLAPDSERSGTSHSLSLRKPIKISKIKENVYSCSANPADCVIISQCGFKDFKPEVVISGINCGPNLGTDLIFSATAAAAREASFLGIPGIAVSLQSVNNEYEFHPLAEYVVTNLDYLISIWDSSVFININAKSVPIGTKYQSKIACLSQSSYTDSISFHDGPDNIVYCFYNKGMPIYNEIKGSDKTVVNEGKVAISRVLVQPVINNLSTEKQ